MMRVDTVCIEHALPTDAHLIGVLSRDLIESGLKWSWKAPRVAQRIRSSSSLVVVARDHDKVVGFVILRFLNDYVRLDLLAVTDEYQRRGIGRRLVECVEESALMNGKTIVHLELRETNLAARNFYRSLGYIDFVRIPGYYQRQESALRMYHLL